MTKKTTETSRKRKGRPPLRPLKKSEIIRTRVTKAELKTLKKIAAEASVAVPDFLMKPWRKEK
jgi:hypothetical protein